MLKPITNNLQITNSLIHRSGHVYIFQLSDHEIFNLEVEQSKCRDPTADLAEFKGTVNGIRESLSTVRQLKKGKDATAVCTV